MLVTRPLQTEGEHKDIWDPKIPKRTSSDRARVSLPRLVGLGSAGLCPFRPGSTWLGTARPGSVRAGSARLGFGLGRPGGGSGRPGKAGGDRNVDFIK